METLFHTQRPALIAFAHSIVKDWNDAEDIVQDVFLKCFTTHRTNFTKPYLFQSVRNSAFNLVRNRNRFQFFIQKWGESLDKLFIPSSQSEPNLMSYLDKLPSTQKEVLILRIKGELKVSEISTILNIPEGTVKSRINLALAKLRKQLNSENI